MRPEASGGLVVPEWQKLRRKGGHGELEDHEVQRRHHLASARDRPPGTRNPGPGRAERGAPDHRGGGEREGPPRPTRTGRGERVRPERGRKGGKTNQTEPRNDVGRARNDVNTSVCV